MSRTVRATPLGIAIRNISPDLIRLLKACKWCWVIAVRWHKLLLVVIPMAGLLSLTLEQVQRMSCLWIAFLAMCLRLADTALVERYDKEILMTEAKAASSSTLR